MRLKSLILGAASLVALASPSMAQELTAITGGRVLTGTSVIENGALSVPLWSNFVPRGCLNGSNQDG